MKSLFAVLVFLVAGQAMAQATADCARPETVQYRRAARNYGNIILKQWVCAAANGVPFEQRDSNQLVRACEQSPTAVLYVQVGGGRSAQPYCAILSDSVSGIQSVQIIEVGHYGEALPRQLYQRPLPLRM